MIFHVLSSNMVASLLVQCQKIFLQRWRCRFNLWVRKIPWRKVKVKSFSRVQLFATSWTRAYGASPSMGFSRQEYWSGLPFPSPGDLPDPGIKPGSAALEADALTSEPPGKPKSYLRNSQSKGDTLIFLSVSCKQKINLSWKVPCLHLDVEKHFYPQR